MVKQSDMNTGNAWNSLWVSWDWDGWIRRQVDLAKSIGANCIRIIGSIMPVSLGALTMPQLLDRWEQLLDYLESQDMYAYPCAGDMNSWGAQTFSVAPELYAQLGSLFNRYSNVIGIDISNEASPANLSAIATLSSVLRGVTKKPLAQSTIVNSSSRWENRFLGDLDKHVDFIDVHVYNYNPALTDPNLLSAHWFGNKPVLIGEFGVQRTTMTDVNLRNAYYRSVRDLVVAHPHINGALIWDIMSDNMGLFSVTGEPRPDTIASFQEFPTS